MGTGLRALLVILTLIVWAGGPAAAAPPSVMLGDLTTAEVQAAIRAGATTVIIPVGGTEQSGPAVALGKHNVRAGLLSARIAMALGNTLVAPVIAYVPEGDVSAPSGHLAFAGTITIPEATFETVVEYAARSLRLAGFRDIVLLGDHGGYQANLQRVADRLDREWKATPVRVHFIAAYYAVTQTDYVAALKARGLSADEIGTHAGLADTSLMLALDPALVRSEVMAARKPGQADGVAGDPRKSSAALGQIGVDLIVSKTVAAIAAAVRR